MKSAIRRLACVSGILLFTAQSYADTIDRANDLTDRDVQAIREWINTKRQVSVKELGGALSISGEVRTEFQTTNEKVNGIKQRGPGGATGLNSNAYDIEVNLMFDYRTDRTWAAIKLEFDNDAGIFSGSTNKIKLEKAFFGGRAIDADSYTFDFELGRRKMGTILDSKLEFTSFFDGIWIKYDHAFENLGDLYFHVGSFLIDERHDQYGIVGEMGLLNIGDTGLYTKYSLIDWDLKHFSDPIRQQRFDFLISQLIVGYRFLPKPLNKVVLVYLAGLWNHNAKRLAITDNTRANWGSYIGFSIGELKKRNDFALDVNYQLLAAQAVPDYDVSGIGLGNAANAGFYTTNINGTGAPTTIANAAGNGNYRGYMITFDYLITNNLMFETQWQQSVTLNRDIGPMRRFNQFEIEFIYAF